MFDFVFKMFSEGRTAIPNLGMEEIPKQLAAPLPKEAILTDTTVNSINGQTVRLADGSAFSAPHIIVATQATGLIKEFTNVKTEHQSTTHLHFVTDIPSIDQPLIALNTNPQRLVNNICTINKIAKAYAPEGTYLVSVSIIGATDLSHSNLEKAVRKELGTFFGKITQEWKCLHSREVIYALPDQRQVRHQLARDQYKIRDGLYVCGDHLLNGSINAAMQSGRMVAELISKQLTTENA